MSKVSRTCTRVAVPSEAPGGLEAQRSGHFGHCEFFTIVDLVDGAVDGVGVLQNAPHGSGGCMAPVSMLAQQGVDALIVVGIGGRPLLGCRQVGITVYVGEGEDVQDAVTAYLGGGLAEVGPDEVCQH